MSDAVTFQLGAHAGAGRGRKRRRVVAADDAKVSSATRDDAFLNGEAAAVVGNKEHHADEDDCPVVVTRVDVVAAKPEPANAGSSADADSSARGGEIKTEEEDAAPVSQIARLIERRRLKQVAGALDEDAAYKLDIEQCSDAMTAEDYSRVPIESFGASLLKRMGWDGKPDGKSEALANGPVSRLLGGEKERALKADAARVSSGQKRGRTSSPHRDDAGRRASENCDRSDMRERDNGNREVSRDCFSRDRDVRDEDGRHRRDGDRERYYYKDVERRDNGGQSRLYSGDRRGDAHRGFEREDRRTRDRGKDRDSQRNCDGDDNRDRRRAADVGSSQYCERESSRGRYREDERNDVGRGRYQGEHHEDRERRPETRMEHRDGFGSRHERGDRRPKREYRY